MSQNQSTLRFSYRNMTGKMASDTLTFSYTRRHGEYESPTLLCGGGGVMVYYDSLKIVANTAKMPVIIELKGR